MQGDQRLYWLPTLHTFGVRGFDTKKALDIMRRQNGREQKIGSETRLHLDQYLSKGYMNAMQLEYACRFYR